VPQTITEALAELKTIGKRIQKKREFIVQHIGRFEMNKDPLEKDGGSVAGVQREIQAATDLHERMVSIRRAIQQANTDNQITVEGETRSIADWLVWRREVAPEIKAFQSALRNGIGNIRSEAKKRDSRVVESSADARDAKDVIIHISESKLAEDIEHLELVLGTLDGQLSLKNATIVIDV
jgi:hypothetical protein